MTTTIKRTRIILIIILLVIIMIVYVSNPVITNTQEAVNEDDYHTLQIDHHKYIYNSSIIPVLLLGIDSNNQEVKLGQSDAIMLLLLDRNNKQIQLLTIPRDTILDIHLYDPNGNDLGFDKQHLNLAYSYGKNPNHGCLLSCEAISRLFNNIPIIYYASIDLSLLNSLQDVVGDIEVEVPNNSAINNNPQYYQGNTVTISNDNVESYLRYRNTNESYSNNDRINRQISYLKSYLLALKNNLQTNHDDTVKKMYSMYQKMITNVKYEQMLDFGDMLLTYQFNGDEDIYKLVGTNKTAKVHDEYIVDDDQLLKMTCDLFYKEDK